MGKVREEARAKPRFFYGYWILATGFLCMMIMSGCNVYSFGLYVKELENEFGWNREGIMLASTISTLIHATASLLVGRIITRLGSKKLMIAGALLGTLSFAFVSTMKELWQFYLFYGLSGIGFAGMGFIPLSALTLAWFKRRRGMAVGITGVGIGVGGFIMPLLIGSYIIPTFGWRMGFLVSAILISAVVIPLALLVIKERPEDIGLQADGATDSPEEVAAKAARASVDGISLKEAAKTPAFWLISLTGLAFGYCSQSLIQHQAAHLQDIGITLAVAAGALSITGIANAIGKFCFGYVCDYIEPKYTRALGLVFALIAVFILMNLDATSSITTMQIYAIFVGLSMGSWLPSMSMLVSSNFGLLAYGVIFGFTSLFNQLGSSVGPLITGRLYDTQGSYYISFIVFIVLCGVGAATTLLIQRPKSYKSEETKGHTH